MFLRLADLHLSFHFPIHKDLWSMCTPLRGMYVQYMYCTCIGLLAVSSVELDEQVVPEHVAQWGESMQSKQLESHG